MLPTRRGSFHLFRIAGIDIYLHWSWFALVVIEIYIRTNEYTSVTWNALEYLALFAIVLMHEMGHALACRQVGGTANQIVLWPLGGVAYVAPPQRPGAMLWSIAAGPLVNVALAPILTIMVLLGRSSNWAAVFPNAYEFLFIVWVINFVLLVFNILPIYPLDGGQILRSLLWFKFGRSRSLMISSVVGFIGVAGLIGFSVWVGSYWLGFISVFILMNCWRGLMQARLLARADSLPRHTSFACPSCQMPPIMGAFCICGKCHQRFDPFATQGVCPQCGTQFHIVQCPECGATRALNEWIRPMPATPSS